MASVSGTNNSSYTSLSSQIRGYGGLASGLDRDTLIEQMTSGTRGKIAKEKQKQTKLQWQQDAMRDITSKIYNFTSDYTSFSSSKNLLSSNLFSRNQITAVGENSKYVSVTGTAASGENMSIARVKQLASNASLTTGEVSARVLQTQAMKLGEGGKLSEKSTVSTIVGDAFYLKYGTQSYTVKLEDADEFDYTDPAKAIDAINKALEKIEIGSGTNAQKMSDVVKVEMDGDKVKFTLNEENAHGNTVQFNGGTGNILQDLGLLKEDQKFGDLTDEEKTITAKGLTGKNAAKLTEEKTLAERLSGAQISFKYNGESQWIKLDDYKSDNTIEDVQKDLQKKLDEAFGKGRIEVTAEKEGAGDDSKFTGQLSFATVKPGKTGKERLDESSTLSITSGAGITGKSGAFGILAGTSNRLNMSANLANSGLKNADKFRADEDGKYKLEDKDGNYNLTINGKKVEGITRDSTVKEIVDKINSTEGIGVTASYQEMSDRFVLTSTEKGASGEIEFDVAKEGETENIAKYLFGNITPDPSDTSTASAEMPTFTYEKGQDAILNVKYPGSKDEVEITRGSNTFSLDGMDITLKGTFGYKEDGTEDMTVEPITFEATVNADKTVESVKGMIDSFNEILELVNSSVKTKPARDSNNNGYDPLTDEQKADMSESQIEKWEEKAKQGILFGDTDLRMMADNLRTIINSGNSSELSSMGITVSTNYSDNGKLVFDETKFRTALQKDPEAVRNAFTKAASKDENGNTTQGGLMVKMKSVMDKYGSMTGATKGILVERAGSIYAPTSVLSNSLQKRMDSISEYIDRLQSRLESETDRYISQFTSLETLVSQMNNQSSYLSSLFA